MAVFQAGHAHSLHLLVCGLGPQAAPTLGIQGMGLFGGLWHLNAALVGHLPVPGLEFLDDGRPGFQGVSTPPSKHRSLQETMGLGTLSDLNGMTPL